MPTISEFYGIIIRMFFTDHNPPHFHAIYGEFELVVAISPIRIISGKVPNRVRSMVLEWAALHQEELLEDWNRCQKGGDIFRIDPLS
jgi:hypothetical protein